MAADVADELAEIIADRISQIGLDLVKGIVYQIAPDYDPKSGKLLRGKTGHPFVSISHVQPEQPVMAESTNVTMVITRVLTVAIVADKAIVEKDPAPFAAYRAKAIRSLHTYRGDGQIHSVPNACIMHATVRPSSPVQQTAWAQAAKFVSTFDVLFQTEEQPGVL